MLAAGASTVVGTSIRLADLARIARWDPDAMSTNRLGQPVSGAYVVDDIHAGGCVASGGVYGDKTFGCTPDAAAGHVERVTLGHGERRVTHWSVPLRARFYVAFN